MDNLFLISVFRIKPPGTDHHISIITYSRDEAPELHGCREASPLNQVPVLFQIVHPSKHKVPDSYSLTPHIKQCHSPQAESPVLL